MPSALAQGCAAFRLGFPTSIIIIVIIIIIIIIIIVLNPGTQFQGWIKKIKYTKEVGMFPNPAVLNSKTVEQQDRVGQRTTTISEDALSSNGTQDAGSCQDLILK